MFSTSHRHYQYISGNADGGDDGVVDDDDTDDDDNDDDDNDDDDGNVGRDRKSVV